MDAYLPFLWLAIILGSFVVEANTAALVSIWFAPAALISMTLGCFGVPLPIQLIVFLLLSLVFILISFKFLRKKIKGRKTATNADSLIGENAVVIENINNLACTGQVRVKGQVWTARSSKEEVKYDKEEILKVIAIEGVKLIVEKENLEK